MQVHHSSAINLLESNWLLLSVYIDNDAVNAGTCIPTRELASDLCVLLDWRAWANHGQTDLPEQDIHEMRGTVPGITQCARRLQCQGRLETGC